LIVTLAAALMIRVGGMAAPVKINIPVHDIYVSEIYSQGGKWYMVGNFFAGIYDDVLPDNVFKDNPPTIYLAKTTTEPWQKWPFLKSWVPQTATCDRSGDKGDGTGVTFTIKSDTKPDASGMIAVAWYGHSHPQTGDGNHKETTFAMQTYSLSSGAKVKNLRLSRKQARKRRAQQLAIASRKMRSDSVIPIDLIFPMIPRFLDVIPKKHEDFWHYEDVDDALAYASTDATGETFPLSSKWDSVTYNDLGSGHGQSEWEDTKGYAYVIVYNFGNTWSANGRSAEEVDGVIRKIGD